MKKILSLLTVFTFVTSGNLVGIGVTNTKINLRQKDDNNVDQVVYNLLTQVINKLTVNGSSLTINDEEQDAFPEIWGTINQAIPEAEELAKGVPEIGEQVVLILEKLNMANFTVATPFKKFYLGTNIVLIYLTLDETGSLFNMILTGVRIA